MTTNWKVVSSDYHTGFSFYRQESAHLIIAGSAPYNASVPNTNGFFYCYGIAFSGTARDYGSRLSKL